MARSFGPALLGLAGWLTGAVTVASPLHAQTHATPAPPTRPAHISPIPAGAYTATITRAALARSMPAAQADSMAGPVTQVFDSTGHVSVQRNGHEVVNADFRPAGAHQIRFVSDSGAGACHVRGVYRYTLRGDQLTFRNVNDTCKPRLATLTAGPWTRDH